MSNPVLAQWPDCAVTNNGEELTQILRIKLDNESALTVATAREALKAGKFSRVHNAREGHSFGFVKGALWLSLDLPSTSQTCFSLLTIPQSRLDRVEIFPFIRGQMQTPLLMGDAIEFNQRSVPHRYLNIRLLRKAGEPMQLLMRVQSSSSIQTPVWLHSEPSLLRSSHNEQIGEGIYFGILLALLLYNFAVMVSIREASYFYYVAYALAFALLMLSFSGYGFQFLWPESPAWQNLSLPISLALLLASSVGFARSFLNLKEKVPLLGKLAVFALPIAIVFGVLACVPNMLMQATIALNVSLVLFSIIITAGGILSAIRGYVPAIYFMLAWSLLMLGGVALPLSSFGLLPRSLLTEYGLQLGSAAEMLLLSFSLAYRITLLRNENARIEQDARLNLEKRVEQRTEELAQIAQQLRDANKRLSDMSLRDGLTGIYNRRYLDETLPRHMAACFEQNLPIAVLMLDIDHFKQVNDQYGHGVGDDCLKLLVQRTSKVIREEMDFTARYGGEEFAIVLFGADIDKASAIAERLRQNLADTPLEIEPEPLAVTLSIGVASARQGSVDELLDAADKALYQAKRTGRNKVCVV
ncbi:MAG: sensor domain-containing diguanylate cyclase [Arenimonas sp.]